MSTSSKTTSSEAQQQQQQQPSVSIAQYSVGTRMNEQETGVDRVKSPIFRDQSSTALVGERQMIDDSNRQPIPCSNCQRPIETGQFVRALGGCFHTDCFRCLECNRVVADRFFPLDYGDGKLHALCERDYFKRLDLICAKCGEALRGSYINAVGKKFHLDHLTCSKCSTVFGPDETYYEHDGEIFCHYHYSITHAARCGGCRMPILKQYVEIRSSSREQWHPECYMIFKSWSLRMSPHGRADATVSSSPEECKLQERLMEEKVNRIWTVLSAFEESAASCISDMLLHVSSQGYGDAMNEAGNFILHVDCLFAGIDSLEKMIAKYSDNIGLIYNKEPKLLCKKIVNFFSLLSHAYDTNAKQYGAITQELLSLVTSLAQYFKVLIRIALAGALKLERTYGEKTAIGDLLNRMVQLGQQQADLVNSPQRFEQRYKTVDMEVKSDLCMSCKVSIEEACIKLGTLRWHKKCFVCSVTKRDLLADIQNACYDPVENCLLGPQHSRPGVKKGFEKSSQLQQYVFLLRVALKRLHSLLKLKEDSIVSKSETASSSSSANVLAAHKNSFHELRRALIDGQSTSTGANASGSGEQAAVAEEDKLPPVVQKRVENPPESLAGSVHNLIESLNSPAADASTATPQSPPVPLQMPQSPALLSGGKSSTAATVQSTNSADQPPQSKIMFIAELSALEIFILRHVTILKLHPLVQDHFTMSELLDMIRSKKASFWVKIISSLNPVKRQVKTKEQGTFGVQLDTLLEKSGVDSKHGSGLGRIRIPAFVDLTIAALKKMDLTAEGIFRKNGNIKNLALLQDAIDKDAWGVNYLKEGPIQLAALLKKFLREMPEPLLTFKLHRLFILSQKAQSVEQRKRILHLCICLLPKPNRDLLEVFLVFLRQVASFSGDDTGNKMDMNNLATVIAPNILYGKAKDDKQQKIIGSAKDESFLAIDAVKMLMQHQDEMWIVPQDAADILVSNDLPDADLSAKDVLKKYENLITTNTKKNQSADILTDSPASPMAIPMFEDNNAGDEPMLSKTK